MLTQAHAGSHTNVANVWTLLTSARDTTYINSGRGERNEEENRDERKKTCKDWEEREGRWRE